jgi:hypothetical protein
MSKYVIGQCVPPRCESNNGVHNITSSYYHSSINVPVPEWTVQTSWGANNVLQRFDNVIMALWSLFQVISRSLLYGHSRLIIW